MKRMSLVLLIVAAVVGGAFAQSTGIDFDQAVSAARPSSTVMQIHLRTILGTEVYMVAETDGTVTYVDAQDGDVLDTEESDAERGFGRSGGLIDELVGSVDYAGIVRTARSLADRDDLVALSLMPGQDGLLARAVFGAEHGGPFARGVDEDAEMVAFDVQTGEEIELGFGGPMDGRFGMAAPGMRGRGMSGPQFDDQRRGHMPGPAPGGRRR
jgi:hypothetical protein